MCPVGIGHGRSREWIYMYKFFHSISVTQLETRPSEPLDPKAIYSCIIIVFFPPLSPDSRDISSLLPSFFSAFLIILQCTPVLYDAPYLYPPEPKPSILTSTDHKLSARKYTAHPESQDPESSSKPRAGNHSPHTRYISTIHQRSSLLCFPACPGQWMGFFVIIIKLASSCHSPEIQGPLSR